MDAKRALITGSSRGIGRAVALRLAQDGWQIGVHYAADEDEAAKVKKQLGKKCVGVYGFDLAQPENAKKLWEAALADGPVTAVVNNAGVYLPLNFVASGEAAFRANLHRTFAVNFESPLQLTRLACRHFASNGGGKVLNVASRVGFRGEGGLGQAVLAPPEGKRRRRLQESAHFLGCETGIATGLVIVERLGMGRSRHDLLEFGGGEDSTHDGLVPLPGQLARAA